MKVPFRFKRLLYRFYLPSVAQIVSRLLITFRTVAPRYMLRPLRLFILSSDVLPIFWKSRSCSYKAINSKLRFHNRYRDIGISASSHFLVQFFLSKLHNLCMVFFYRNSKTFFLKHLSLHPPKILFWPGFSIFLNPFVYLAPLASFIFSSCLLRTSFYYFRSSHERDRRYGILYVLIHSLHHIRHSARQALRCVPINSIFVYTVTLKKWHISHLHHFKPFRIFRQMTQKMKMHCN